MELAIKRLTGSDLTLFEWQFRTIEKGNQKSINLNANVFVGQLYPFLPSADIGVQGFISLNLFIYGPGHAKALNFQRKIIKGGKYKNWRLNGEYIPNPLEDPERFKFLAPGDYAIFDFDGDLLPTTARMVLVSANTPEDVRLHAGLTDYGLASMTAIEMSQLRLIVHASGTPEAHPVYELLLDAALEDAAQSGLEGTTKLLTRSGGRRITRAELERARQRASETGRLGEELLDAYFAIEVDASRMASYVWAADENAVSPFDFVVERGCLRKVEVKSTTGDFGQVIHFSIGELIAMRDTVEPYDVYRIYELDGSTAKLRVAEDVKVFANEVLDHIAAFAAGITVDSVSVRPDVLGFADEIIIDVSDDEEIPQSEVL